MYRTFLIAVLLSFALTSQAQLAVARDTISVLENGYVLKMPWANGLNYANVSQVDLDLDGKKDIIIFDRSGSWGGGRFRCFINKGNSGETVYRADPGLSYGLPKANDWAVFHDYDCDGKEDLFCSTILGIKVYRNTSNSSHGLNFTLVKQTLYSDYNPGGNPYISNIYASPVGVPAIADIDGDGDLDILTFSSQGIKIEYHKNRSIEKYGKCDSLVFTLEDYCWGNISESSCEVDFNACPSQKIFSVLKDGQNKPYHAGSCMTCLDSDADGDKDLIMGDVSCNTLQYVHNNGSTATALFNDTTMLYPNYPNKGSTTQIKMNNFPCAYTIDANNDGKLDLLASPNAPNGENHKSLWYYKNTSTTSTVNFLYQKNNFLQEDMIEVGQNSFPVLFDYNADGKKDLLIGSLGYYTNNTMSSRLTLYENVGTASTPVFSLVTRDYAGLSTKNLSGAIPAVGDVDGDGEVDICVGVPAGQVHWIENTAGAGQICNFSAFKTNPFTFTATSGMAAPQLFDLDGDGKQDLLVGTKNGRISFYKNTSTGPTAVTFSLVSNVLGNVDVKDNQGVYGLDAFAVPFFYNDGSGIRLLVGSISGKTFEYSVTNSSSAFTLLGTQVNGYNEGEQSAPWFEDINNDAKRDLFLGNTSGGLSFFSSTSPNVGIGEDRVNGLQAKVLLFPNPARDHLNIEIDLANSNAQVNVLDVCGKIVFQKDLNANKEQVDIGSLEPGIYFVKTTIRQNNQLFSVTKKIIKQN